MAEQAEKRSSETRDPSGLAPILTRLTSMTKLYQTQLDALDEVQRTLDEQVTGMLVNLEQRPVVDVTAITTRLDQTIDAVDRVMQRRIPRLVARRWWVCWLWLGTGLVVGSLLTYWTLDTQRGRAMLQRLWPAALSHPAGLAQPAAPTGRKAR